MPRGQLQAMRPPNPRDSDPAAAELRAWMEQIRDGDEQALAALFRAVYSPLCSYARTYVRSATAAEDIVEDTFLKLWADRDKLYVQGSVKSYLYVTVRHRALNYLRRQSLEARYFDTVSDAADRAADTSDPVDEVVETEELMVLVQAAIDGLPPRTRQAYTLYTQHGMRHADVARVMGISVRTVEHQVASAVRTLWGRLKEATQ